MTKTDSKTQDSIWEKETIQMAQKRTGNFFEFSAKTDYFGVKKSIF